MSGCFTCVSTNTVEPIERFGKLDRFADAGCNFLNPCLCESVAGVVSLRVQQLDVHCETKTKDNVFVNVTVSVQYQVVRESIMDAFYKLTNPKEQIRSYVFDVVRSTVPSIDLDDVFQNKEKIATQIKSELEKTMSGFGFFILQALVTDIDPDEKVKRSMNEINATQRMRKAAVEKAEAEKVAVIKAAEGDAEAKFLAGQGIARQRTAIVNGLKDSVVQFSESVNGITSRDVMEMMLVTQYFDMLKDVGQDSGTSTIFIPHAPGAVNDVSAQVRQGFMEGKRA